MFGLSLSSNVFQGSAVRTWNCVSYIINLLRFKLNQISNNNMPRPRRRHHSRSRSRSRSHSHDRDRDPKRRKVESYESPHQRRSVSSEPSTKRKQENLLETFLKKTDASSNECVDRATESPKLTQESDKNEIVTAIDDESVKSSAESSNNSFSECKKADNCKMSADEDAENAIVSTSDAEQATANEESILVDSTGEEDEEERTSLNDSSTQQITPKKTLSMKQLQRRAESEKKRLEKIKEREDREKERQRIKEEKERLRLEKEEQKLKERLEKQKEKEMKDEQKRKEREEKELKKKERDEKEEQKRKEKEKERLKRQMEIDEKNKEKLKAEEQKQRAAAVFANFFVAKKTARDDNKRSEPVASMFMPFEVKSDMRLAPLNRRIIDQEAKELLDRELEAQDACKSYLNDLRNGKEIGKTDNTWPLEADDDDDVIIMDVANDLGQSIIEQKGDVQKKMRAKYLHFCENRRPPYFGTWRKRSASITARKPFVRDRRHLDYEIDSDDEWEEEDPGESLRGSDDEDKENDSGNEYEVDNDFFVPHGHLSEDEMDDEETATFSPESHKVKLKLLKNEFDEEMKLKTQKLKPRVIGCIWYDKDHAIEDAAIDRYLKPFTVLFNKDTVIKRRSELEIKSRNSEVCLDKEHVRDFIRLIDGNTQKKKRIVEEFWQGLREKNVVVFKSYLLKLFKTLAQWVKVQDSNSKKYSFNWSVNDELKKEHCV